ncbi:MAG: hypothetical protein ISS47_06510, partial [Candidatus Omnitrophica bacterium]|nr:hypothetical protein [Candidatus Omnitrophota bacterium]
MPILNPNSLKIGYVILVATHKPAIKAVQEKAGYGDSSKWTHVAGSLGGYTAIEARIPRSRLINLQREYVDKGCDIKVLRRKGQDQHKRYKVALWWATMNNLPYDILQFIWCNPNMIMSYSANLKMSYSKDAIMLPLEGGHYGRKGHYRNDSGRIKK